jgi:transmembrane 9 superfamily protein 3
VGSELSFTYSVTWNEVGLSYPDRAAKLSDPGFFRAPVHFYAALNTGLLDLLLVILVAILMTRIVARDYNRLIQEAAFDGFDVDLASEQGWKALHGDVFRPPVNLGFLSVFGGTGVHLFSAVLSYSAVFQLNRPLLHDSSFTIAIIAYILTAPLGGFFAVALGRAFGYARWLRLAFGESMLFPGFLFIVYTLTSLLGSSSGSSRTFSVFFLIVMTVIDLTLLLPLSAIGGIIAIKVRLFAGNKCEVAFVPRAIPSYPWYLKQPVLGAVVGLICTGAVMIEVYYALTTLWLYTGLYVWSYFIAGVLSLGIVAGTTTILAIYLLLQNEVHHWQWPSFIAPGFTGLYVFGYSLYFMCARTKVSGVFQIAYFVGYSAVLSAAVAGLAGGVGFTATNIFVHKIFSNLKLD